MSRVTVKKITVTVNPTGTTLTKVENLKGKKMKMTWKKNAKVTGYQIRYSTSAKFTAATTKRTLVTSNNTLNKTVAKLALKKKYFIQVRTYKTVSKVKYYSAWSGTKNVIIKK